MGAERCWCGHAESAHRDPWVRVGSFSMRAQARECRWCVCGDWSPIDTGAPYSPDGAESARTVAHLLAELDARPLY